VRGLCSVCGSKDHIQHPFRIGRMTGELINGRETINERSLGGEGDLNLPYEPVPGGPANIEDDFLIAGGVVVRAAVVAHPVTSKPHPVLIFDFHLPDGSVASTVLLVIERDELEALPDVIRGAALGAVEAADRNT
jgi:hypothetical protein